MSVDSAVRVPPVTKSRRNLSPAFSPLGISGQLDGTLTAPVSSSMTLKVSGEPETVPTVAPPYPVGMKTPVVGKPILTAGCERFRLSSGVKRSVAPVAPFVRFRKYDPGVSVVLSSTPVCEAGWRARV